VLESKIAILKMGVTRITNAIQTLPESAEIDVVYDTTLSMLCTLSEMEEGALLQEGEIIRQRNREIYGFSKVICGHPSEDRI
jgi:hypothetical protein